ncbi:ABC transporter permease subunit [Brachybacterium sp. EF45031]|uniref:ABC transporter permease n=1 Tax=Brachybacterium sillae TaxID=2810536 RepID=UPI00217EFA6F|nr:ABC transporter permease subunit [Brachybacterium sillae]MCS6711540.1 ABC transporter permease subunit [Brachybacterium sillae]
MTWLLANLDLVGRNLLAHLGQAVPPILLALLLSVPLAKLTARRPLLRNGVSVGSGLLYAVPSLPLFIVLPLIIGTSIRSPVNVIIALTLYGLALMVPAAQEAFRSVRPDALDAATAQGFTPLARFTQVELPLAGPALLAGLRVVTVSTVSLVTVGGVLGVPSLGMLFIDGFQRGIIAEVLTGIIATVLLALVLDALLVALGRLLMPWTRSRAGIAQRSEGSGDRRPGADATAAVEVRA